MKRWGTMATMAVAALALLAPTASRAAVPGYTFSAPVCAKGDLDGANLFQIGDVNNKGQFVVNFVLDGEKLYVWDGSKLTKVSESDIKIPDGSAFSTGNVWSPHALNNEGVVAWVADMDGSGAGVKYILTYEIATRKYNIIAKPGDPAPGGGQFGDNGAGASGRMLADINDKGQIVWNVAVDVEGEPRSGVFMYDPATKQITAVARPGATVDGKTITHAWWPMINNEGQVVFSASLAGGAYGIFLADKGNLTTIAGPGTKVGDVTIAEARWADIANNGDIVFVADTADAQGGAGEVTENTAVILYSAADKALKVVVKPGDALPDGSTFSGVENSRRVVRVNNDVVALVGVRADEGTGIYLFDKKAGRLQSLILGNTDVPGLGQVASVSKGIGGVTGYHLGLSDNGIVVFPAVVAGIECFVTATPPAPPTAGN